MSTKYHDSEQGSDMLVTRLWHSHGPPVASLCQTHCNRSHAKKLMFLPVPNYSGWWQRLRPCTHLYESESSYGF